MSEENGKRFEKVLSIKEVSKMIHYSESWLYHNLEKGPKYHRVGKGRIRYFRSDVISWMQGTTNNE